MRSGSIAGGPGATRRRPRYRRRSPFASRRRPRRRSRRRILRSRGRSARSRRSPIEEVLLDTRERRSALALRATVDVDDDGCFARFSVVWEGENPGTSRPSKLSTWTSSDSSNVSRGIPAVGASVHRSASAVSTSCDSVSPSEPRRCPMSTTKTFVFTVSPLVDSAKRSASGPKLTPPATPPGGRVGRTSRTRSDPRRRTRRRSTRCIPRRSGSRRTDRFRRPARCRRRSTLLPR